MNNLEKQLKEQIIERQAANLLRVVKNTERTDGSEVIRDGKKLVSFSCNDYLGLSLNEKVKRAAIDATNEYGTGSGASRLVTGNNPLFTETENKLAELYQTESACIFTTGYTANYGCISTLMSENDLIVADKLSHSCIIEGAQASGAEFKRFLHNDIASLDRILEKNRKEYENCLVITEAVFSMDGDVAPLEEIARICKNHHATLMIDHAHDLTHYAEHKNLSGKVIHMGTMSKALGSLGGYIAASKTICDYLKTACKSLINSTALQPSALAASLKSLELISKQKSLVDEALKNADYFRKTLKQTLPDADTGNSASQIVPLIIGTEEDALNLSEHLFANGYLVHAIRPPTVPAGTSRLRFSFSSAHTKEQIDKLISIIAGYLK